MKTNKGKQYIILALMLVLLVGIIYRYNPDRSITLRLGIYAGSSWDVPYASPYAHIDQVIKRFEKENPRIHITYTSGITKEDYSSWLSDSIINGKQCDLFVVPSNDFNLLADTKALANLNSFVGFHYTNIEEFYSASLKAGEVNGSLYAFPYESNPMMMCVNLDLLKKEGIKMPSSNWSFQDFYQICKKVTKDTNQDGLPDYFGVTNYTWEMALEENGASLFNDEGSKCYLNSEKVRKALSQYVRLEALNGKMKVTQSDFDRGNVAFMPMSLAEYRTYRSYPYRVSRYSKFNWRCMPMPGSAHYKIPVNTTLFAISSRSQYKDEAWSFLNDLCLSQSNQQKLFSSSSGASVLKSVMTSPTTKRLLEKDHLGAQALSVQTINQMMKSSKPYPHFKKYYEVMELADNEVSQALEAGELDEDLPQIQNRITYTLSS